jgi:hypothetical protein
MIDDTRSCLQKHATINWFNQNQQHMKGGIAPVIVPLDDGKLSYHYISTMSPRVEKS